MMDGLSITTISKLANANSNLILVINWLIKLDFKLQTCYLRNKKDS